MKKLVLGIMIGGIVFGSIGVYAGVTYSSNLIIYKTADGDKTVEEVLNELYPLKTKGDALEDNITLGKKVIVKGKEIIGNGKDNTTNYNLGYDNGLNDCKANNTVRLTMSSVKYDWGTPRYYTTIKLYKNDQVVASTFVNALPDAQVTYDSGNL